MEQTVTIKLDIRDAHRLFTALLGVNARAMLHPAVCAVTDDEALSGIDLAIEKLHIQLKSCVFLGRG